MVGIGGTGMSSAARLLLAGGCKLSGSDSTASGVTAEMARIGAMVSIGHSRENIPDGCDLVVTTAAARPDNPEVVEAKKRNLHIIKYARLVGLMMRDRMGIGVAGTHGKTTTSSMLAEVLRFASLKPSYIIGGKIVGHRQYDCAGSGQFFVAEACEYDRSFLSLCPTYSIITNVEPDHLDYYGSKEALYEAFKQYLLMMPSHGMALIGGDSAAAVEAARAARCRIMTYGLGEHCDWRVRIHQSTNGISSFELAGPQTINIEISLPGEHNIINAAGVAALAASLGVKRDVIAAGLAGFQGVERRFQMLTPGMSISVIDDYAHHPTEIAAVLRGARNWFPGRRLWVVFQAHQHSRTRAFFEDFAQSLTLADRVTIAKIFSVRETEYDRMSVNGGDIAGRLYQLSTESEYLPDFRSIEYLLDSESSKGDVIIIMGAGDIYKVGHSFAQTLKEKAYGGVSAVKAAV